MARGNGRQDIVCDDVDRERLQEQLGKAAIRCSWRVYAFAIMSNHLHVVLKTPEPNLSRGMQSFLSGYANAWSRRIDSRAMSFRVAIGPSWWKTRPTSRERSIRRTRQSNGARRTAPRTAQGITTIAEFTPLTSHCPNIEEI